jgi:uncharacterized surface protein with fasciclin (FAS1) repeats
MFKRATVTIVLVLLVAMLVTGPADAGKKKGRAGKPTIAEIAAGDENFSTLVAALSAADLVETFTGKEHYTVFAPTNAAFEKALGDLGITAEELLADKEKLTAILLFHVSKGDKYAKGVLESGKVKMLDGNVAEVTTDDEGAYIAGARIAKTDIEASNGVIHVIEYVMLPPMK